MLDEWVDTLSKRLGPPIFTTGEEVRFNCWRSDCGQSSDIGYHLYINPVKDKYFCQRCQRGGNLESLARFLGLEIPGSTIRSWDRIINSFLYGEKKEENEFKEDVQWPPEYQPMVPGTQAYAYLQSRGITDEMIGFYQIGFGTGFLKNRVIFPDLDKNDKLVYWVARTYKHHKNKYRNADAPREHQVFNLGRLEKFNYKEQLIICEGPISAILAGYNATSTYGKYVTGSQIQRLVEFGAAEYVIAGDGDAKYEAVSLATRLWRRGLHVRFARFFGDEDPASIGPEATKDRINNALKWNDMTAMEVLS